ncbi:hypothetical protein K0M31_001494, partial [Melipona bicolor]
IEIEQNSMGDGWLYLSAAARLVNTATGQRMDAGYFPPSGRVQSDGPTRESPTSRLTRSSLGAERSFVAGIGLASDIYRKLWQNYSSVLLSDAGTISVDILKPCVRTERDSRRVNRRFSQEKHVVDACNVIFAVENRD